MITHPSQRQAPKPFDVRKELIKRSAFSQRLPRTPRAAYAPKPKLVLHSITTGIEYDAQGNRLHSSHVILGDIRAYLAREYGGFNDVDSFGSYTNNAGELVQENCVTFNIATDKPILPALAFIRKALNQESLLHVVSEAKVSFYV